jgi:putative oxidoreductase
MIAELVGRYRVAAAALDRLLAGWFTGLAARFVFLAVLLPYYMNSALTKVGDGVFGVFNPTPGAFAQILPPIAEQYVYDTSAIPFFPWHLIVIAGSAAEIVLPVLIVAGLLTRLSAAGMILFVLVQTLVDLSFHGAEAGAWFDRQSGDLLDVRLLWLLPLVLLVAHGAGRLSLDALHTRKTAE